MFESLFQVLYSLIMGNFLIEKSVKSFLDITLIILI